MSQKFPWLDSEFARARWMYCLGIIYLTVGYLATNELAALNPWGRPALPIATEFDKALPFTAWMVVFYITYYPLLGVPLLLAPHPVSMARLTLAQVATQSMAFVIFILFPTPIDRPVAVPVEGVFHTILDVLFRADHPYNTFPSMHVGQSVLVTLFFLKYSARWPFDSVFARRDHPDISRNRFAFWAVAIFAVLSIMITVSAVLIKQHYIADAMSGALIAWAMAWVFFFGCREAPACTRAGL